MSRKKLGRFLATWGVLPVACALNSGCQFTVNMGPGGAGAAPVPVVAPRELCKVMQPDYVIEPPDILSIEVLRSLPDRPIPPRALVRPDGTINLGLNGSVRVAGMTLDQAASAIEQHLASTLTIKNPRVSVDVYAYNSKVYYVITDGAGFGEQVYRLPSTGNETVLDAVSQIGGLPAVSSKHSVFVARPVGPAAGCGQTVMPVDWPSVTKCGTSATNYQILPGDRIYICSDPLIAFDGALSKVIAPIERLFGVTLLGGTTVSRLQNMGRQHAAFQTNAQTAVVVPGGP
jgi:protein involved in polysaccharide export with SLBB domain